VILTPGNGRKGRRPLTNYHELPDRKEDSTCWDLLVTENRETKILLHLWWGALFWRKKMETITPFTAQSFMARKFTKKEVR